MSFDRLHSYLQSHIDNKYAAGLQVLVYHLDEEKFNRIYGYRNIELQEKLDENERYRIFSMTKPVITVAVLQLIERGLLQLDTPISKFIPNFKPEVLETYDRKSGTFTTKPADIITIYHLLTHTSGLSYGFYPGMPIDRIYSSIFEFKTRNYLKETLEILYRDETLDDMIGKLCQVPLLFNPGEHYWYGFNYEILGYIISQIAGTTLEQYLQRYIFKPLNMNKTSFSSNVSLPVVYTHTKGMLIPLQSKLNTEKSFQPKIQSGGGGLITTARDYANFCKMLLHKGRYNNNQIIDKKYIEMMISDQLSEKYIDKIYEKRAVMFSHNVGVSVGMGVLVKTENNKFPTGIGTHYWGGALNTEYWIDPVNNLFCIILNQYIGTHPTNSHPVNLEKITNAVYKDLNII